MVLLHIKRGTNSLFLYETTTATSVEDVLKDVVGIYSVILKVKRLALELDELCNHGPSLPPNMTGLLEEQLAELNLKDDAAETCLPSKGFVSRKDPLLKRNGFAPTEEDAEMIQKTKTEAVNILSEEQLKSNVCLTPKKAETALEIIRGVLSVVYPMGLPDYDPIRQELEGNEDLRGTSHEKEVLRPEEAELWFAGKRWAVNEGKKVGDYLGKNEKTKAVVKLQKCGSGPPAREIGLSDEEKKELMLAGFRRQEELKRLEEEKDLHHLNSDWADPQSLRKAFHGVSDIKFHT